MGLSHLVLHLALCNSALRLKTGTAVPARVVLTDKANRHIVDRAFRLVRENASTSTVDFDMPWGVYRANVDVKAGATTCTSAQYFGIDPEKTRTLALSLREGAPQTPVPVLIYGSVPLAFSYVQPIVVLFDPKQTKCNAAAPPSVTPENLTQNDADGYYATIEPTRDLLDRGPLMTAVRLTDSRGNYHYVRISNDLVHFGTAWPTVATFNVDEGIIDLIAQSPEDALLCPHLYKTSVH